MPTVNLNKNVFEKLVGKKLPLDKLKDRISMLGTDLEKIEGDTIEVEVFPNRPDMLSEQGFARAFSSFIGVKKGLRDFKIKKSELKLIVKKSLPKEWPYAFACIIKGLSFNDEKIREVIQIQEKLGMTLLRKRKKGGIGLYPLEKITFPISFVGEHPDKIKFRPLEYPNEITGRQILSKHSTGRAYAHLVEGWNKFPIFVDAKGIVMSMPPIINSHDVGKIDETTQDVFLEVTGNDFHATQAALTIIATSLIDMGGTLYSIDCIQQDGKSYAIPNLKPKRMKLDLAYCNRWLGLDLKMKDAEKLLEKMGYGCKNGQVFVPAYRVDIMHQVDLFEDIAIAYGYENFDAEIPGISTIGEEDSTEIFKNRIANILECAGLLELNTFNMTNSNQQCTKMKTKKALVEVANAVNSEYNLVRGWMIPTLLGVLNKNKHNEYPQNIFEIGKVFSLAQDTETGANEEDMLGVALCDSENDFTKIKQLLDYFVRMLGFEYDIKDVKHPSFIEGRAGNIVIGNKIVGIIGEINPEVLRNWEIEYPVGAFEIRISEIESLVK